MNIRAVQFVLKQEIFSDAIKTASKFPLSEIEAYVSLDTGKTTKQKIHFIDKANCCINGINYKMNPEDLMKQCAVIPDRSEETTDIIVRLAPSLSPDLN